MNDQRAKPLELLVSVRNAAEVVAAINGGAHWIDLKEPSDGPLAAVTLSVAEEAVQQLGVGRPLSAALGELRDWEHSRARDLLDIDGIELVKIGLAGCAPIKDWQRRWNAISQAAAERGKHLVSVMYADGNDVNAPPPAAVLEVAEQAGCRFLLIDTYVKNGHTTFDCFSPAELAEKLYAARALGMTTVLAGSIRRELIAKIPGDLVDIVAVRGAVCRGGRDSAIDVQLVAEFRSALAAGTGRPANTSRQPA